MIGSGERRKEVIRPDFNRAIMIDFQGAKITSDVGFLFMREIDERFKIIAPVGDCLEDLRSLEPASPGSGQDRVASGRAFPQARLCDQQLQATGQQGDQGLYWPGRDRKPDKGREEHSSVGQNQLSKVRGQPGQATD
jgi:hypothetical protein